MGYGLLIMNIHLSSEKAVTVAWRFGLAMLRTTVSPALADPGDRRESENHPGDTIGWNSSVSSVVAE
jgi:hypothetical protein